MRIVRKFRADAPLLSVEIFPPKTDAGITALKEKLGAYARYAPDFISVTYGAGGGTRGRTAELCSHIQDELGIQALAHLTCSGHSRDELRGILSELRDRKIANLIALRGDPPKGEVEFRSARDGLSYANELISLIRAEFDFGVACAGYPEGHIEAISPDADLDHLRRKIDAGAEFVITQFFLDNVYFHRFREKLRRKGIDIPVVAGILPISNFSQVTKFSLMCGCTIPARVMKGLYGRSDADQEKFGLDHAAWQLEDLLDQGIDGVHLYALNKQQTVERLAPIVRGRFPAVGSGSRT